MQGVKVKGNFQKALLIINRGLLYIIMYIGADGCSLYQIVGILTFFLIKMQKSLCEC